MPNKRPFEHVLHSQGKRSAGAHRPRQARYERLMRVSLMHTYYNRSGLKCPDFEIHPTPTSATLMQSLDLLFKPERAGFSVLYNVAGAESLTSYLRRQSSLDADSPPQAGEVWTRLSFVLSLTNPYFVNFTNISIKTDPLAENFYFTNQYAHRAAGGAAVINPDVRGGDFALHPVEVSGTQVHVTMGEDVKEVHVLDISGEPVICRPRCVPRKLLRDNDPAAITCAEAADCTAGDPACRCTDSIYLDLSLLPEDKYVIQLISYGEDAPHAGSRPPAEREILYTVSYPLPLCFIDLLFTRPTAAEPGIYPINNLFPKEATSIDPVDYEIWFNRRATFWNYYVVPPRRERYEHLFIRSEPHVEFAGPCLVRLPDGATAYRFLSKRPIPLQEESTFDLQLRNRVMPGQDDVIVKRLPVASSRQVIPESPTDACRSLIDSLRPRAEQAERCAELVEFVCGPPGGAPRPSEINHSDTYIYV